MLSCVKFPHGVSKICVCQGNIRSSIDNLDRNRHKITGCTFGLHRTFPRSAFLGLLAPGTLLLGFFFCLGFDESASRWPTSSATPESKKNPSRMEKNLIYGEMTRVRCSVTVRPISCLFHDDVGWEEHLFAHMLTKCLRVRCMNTHTRVGPKGRRMRSPRAGVCVCVVRRCV